MGTNTDSVLGYATNEELKAAIQRRQFLFPAYAIGMGNKKMDTFMTHWRDGYVMPGLKSCANGCPHMVPQGICIAGNYLLITAYCTCAKDKAVRGYHPWHALKSLVGREQTDESQKPARHQSVVYLLEKRTGAYIKTVVLPDKNHVGGIAYYKEGTTGYVVLTGKAGKKGKGGAQLQRYPFEAFLRAKDGGLLSDYTGLADIIPTHLEHASFVSYNHHRHSLAVGYFCNEKSKAEGEAYPQGMMENISLADTSWIIDNSHRKTMKIECSMIQSGLPNQMQGCDFLTDGSMLVSCSYGWRKGAVLGRHSVKGGEVVAESMWQLAMPPYLEEVAVDQEMGCIYMVFESGADLYAWKTPFAIDRIVVWDMEGLESDP